MKDKEFDADFIRAQAREYAADCAARNHRVSLAEMSQRLGYNARWLSNGDGTRASLARAIIVREWIECQANVHGLATFYRERPEVAEPRGETEWNFDYPEGDDLYQVLNHPGRLRQFCDLVETAGPGGAFRYAQQVIRFCQQPSPEDEAE
jgi:hypothetical protein